MIPLKIGLLTQKNKEGPMREIKSIWMLTREYKGIAEAGGVKDVSKELSEALAEAGYEVTVIIPRYGFIRPEESGFVKFGPQFEVDMNYAHEERRERIGFWHKKISDVDILLVEAERYAEKLSVYTYTEAEEALDPSHKKGMGHYDYFAMNVLLQKAALDLSIYEDIKPDVFHCQDGHTAILPAIMRELDGMRQYFMSTGALVTIHNAGIGYHQDVADLPFVKAITGLPWRVIYSCLLNGSFDPFLAGATYAPINTVSENYARELQETELDALTGWLGHALKDRGIRLEGITNGINPDDFDPRRPETLGLPAGFDPLKGDLRGKGICRKELINQINHGEIQTCRVHGSIDNRPNQPLVTVISRLTEQKGINTLAQALEYLLAQDQEFQVVILGTGSRKIETHLISLADHPVNNGRIALLLGYDSRLANLLYASGDFFIIPSKYEPCGLTDFIAQLMANVPIVRATGGLVKVRDGFNGFSYQEFSASALASTIKRAFRIFRLSPDVLRQIQINAIKHIYENYTWDKVMKRYVKLYQKSLAKKVF